MVSRTLSASKPLSMCITYTSAAVVNHTRGADFFREDVYFTLRLVMEVAIVTCEANHSGLMCKYHLHGLDSSCRL